MLGQNIFFWDQLNTAEFACPCYIHTWDQGIYNWGEYQTEEGGPMLLTGPIGICGYTQDTQGFTQGRWRIKHNETSDQWQVIAGVELPAAALANDQKIALAPGIIIQNNVTITVDITLKTTDCTPHTLGIYFSEIDVSGSGTGYPSMASSNSILSNSAFATAAMSTVLDCTGLSSGEFATNNDEVVVTGTFQNTSGAAIVRWLVIDDSSPAVLAGVFSNVTITNIQMTPSDFPNSNVIDAAPPLFNAAVTSNSSISSPNGIIAIDNTVTGMADANCWWCWSDKIVYQGAAPDRTGLNHGWYALKMVSVLYEKVFPVQLVHVPYFNASGITLTDASPGDVNLWYDHNLMSRKGDTLYKDITNGKDTNVLDLLKIEIIKYLWDNTTNSCMTAAMAQTFEDFLTEEFNSCSLDSNLGFLNTMNMYAIPDENAGMGYPYALYLDMLGENLQGYNPGWSGFYPFTGGGQPGGAYGMPGPQGSEELNMWMIEGLIWNHGSPGFSGLGGECCHGYIDYVYPSYVFHNRAIWEPISELSDTTTEPGSFLGRNNWKLTRGKKGRYRRGFKQVLKNLRKNSTFELERDGVPTGGLVVLDMYGGESSRDIALENTKLLTPEVSVKKKIV